MTETPADVLEQMAAELRERAQSADEDGADMGDWYRSRQTACEAGARALSPWRPVSAQMPDPGREVLVFVRMPGASESITRRLRAQWNDGETLRLSDDAEGGVYNEELDEYFCEAGWYESNEFEETHWRIEGDVTHWMDLPEPPRAA
jgi:hypothetical protein